jgi:hypothetical protein
MGHYFKWPFNLPIWNPQQRYIAVSWHMAKQVGVMAMLKTCIWEILGMNISQNTCYPWSSQLLPSIFCTFLHSFYHFDKVWHAGLIFKVRKVFPIQYFRLIKSYLSDRKFRIRVNEEVSSQYTIKSGAPQGSIARPNIICALYNRSPNKYSHYNRDLCWWQGHSCPPWWSSNCLAQTTGPSRLTISLAKRVANQH